MKSTYAETSSSLSALIYFQINRSYIQEQNLWKQTNKQTCLCSSDDVCPSFEALKAKGARQDPCDTDCPGCLLQPPGCWPYSLRPRTEPGYGGGSWWPWQPSGPTRPTAGSPCSLAVRPGTTGWTCPLVFSCATLWSHRGGLLSRCHPPMGDGHFQEWNIFCLKNNN